MFTNGLKNPSWKKDVKSGYNLKYLKDSFVHFHILFSNRFSDFSSLKSLKNFEGMFRDFFHNFHFI